MEDKLKLRDFLVVLLLAVSYGLFFSATSQYNEILFPPDPKVEYHKNIATLYLTASDWETIHLLENIIVLDDLDDGLRQSVIAQNWQNYLRAPSHYEWGNQGTLFSSYQEHKAELYNILINRDKHLDNGAMQSRKIEILEALKLVNKDSERLLLLLSENSKLLEANNLAPLISIDNDLHYNLDVGEFCQDFDIDNNDVSCEQGEVGSAVYKLDESISNLNAQINYPIPLSVTYYFPNYTPKYSEIVYLSFQNLDLADFGESLIDTSFEIFSDPKEDIYLRLLALEKLGDFTYADENREVRKKFTDELYALLEVYNKTGVTLENSKFSSQEQAIFRIYILNQLASSIKVEKMYQILEAQEKSK